MTELTQDLLKELFDYRDGELYWKEHRQGVKMGIPAGHTEKNGYVRVMVNGKHYLAHRLIFQFHRGYLPEFLDHIDGDKLNNDIENLREATHQQNCMNQKKQKSYGGKRTSSGFKGVHWHKQHEKWTASIRTNGKLKHLGYYDSEIDAALAYDVAARERDGKFALTNAMLFPEIFKTKE